MTVFFGTVGLWLIKKYKQMKKLILAAVLMFSFAALARAQKTMIIVNHTPCEWWITPYMDFPGGPGPNGSEVHTTKFANYIGPSTLNVVAPSWPWYDYLNNPVPAYDPAWIWCYVSLSPALCTGPFVRVSGTDIGQSTWATSFFPSSSIVSTCYSGDHTITWTDLNNGNVQIDIW